MVGSAFSLMQSERGLLPAKQSFLGERYSLAVATLFVTGVVFTMVDFVTSFVGLGEGLTEGNSLLLGLAQASNLSTIYSLLVMKVAFIGLLAVVAVLGVKSSQGTTKKMMFACLAVFTVVFVCVSVNNLYQISA